MFKQMALGYAQTGKSVEALAGDVKARLGGLATRQMLSLSAQTTKLKENLNALFAGVKIDGFLKLFQSFVSLFSQGEAIGRGLKALLEALFGPFGESAEGAGRIVKRVMQGAVIATLQLAHLVLDLRDWFRKTFSGASIDIDLATVALNAAKGAVYVLGGVVAATVATIAIAFGGVAVTVGAVTGAVRLLMKLFDVETWRSIGTFLTEGLGEGIKAGFQSVLDSVKAFAQSIENEFRKALSIRSPSLKFKRAGENISLGVAEGISLGAPRAQRSTAQLSQRVAVGFGGRTGLDVRASTAELTASKFESRFQLPATTTASNARPPRRPEPEFNAPHERKPAPDASAKRAETQAAKSVNITFAEGAIRVSGETPTKAIADMRGQLIELLETAMRSVGAAS
jgi:hypothetical protein